MTFAVSALQRWSSVLARPGLCAWRRRCEPAWGGLWGRLFAKPGTRTTARSRRCHPHLPVSGHRAGHRWCSRLSYDPAVSRSPGYFAADLCGTHVRSAGPTLAEMSGSAGDLGGVTPAAALASPMRVLV